MYHRHGIEISLPMAINSKVDTLVILETLLSIKPSKDRSQLTHLRYHLPIDDETAEGHNPFVWSSPESSRNSYVRPAMYSTIFATATKHLALLSWQDSGQQCITLCQYHHDHHQDRELGIHILNRPNLQPGIQKIERIVFHPERDIVAFCVFRTSVFRTRHQVLGSWKNAAFLWAYKKGKDTSGFQLPHPPCYYNLVRMINANQREVYIGPPQIFPLTAGTSSLEIFQTVGFSACGLYFLARPRYGLGITPSIVQIPAEMLDITRNDGPAVALGESSSIAQPAPRVSSILNAADLGTATYATTSAFLASRSTGSSQLWNVNSASGNVSSLAVNASQSGVYLTGSSSSGGQTVKLVALPTWQGASETTQRIILPQFEGDKLKISFDVDTQGLSTHSAYQLSKAGGNVQPTTIFRDTRFIIAGIAQEQGFLADTQQRGKRAFCIDDGEEDEEEPHKRRR